MLEEIGIKYSMYNKVCETGGDKNECKADLACRARREEQAECVEAHFFWRRKCEAR